MGQKHKHAEVIKAWADGAEIEYRGAVTRNWSPIDQPMLLMEDIEYRIKPDPRAARDMAIAEAVRNECRKNFEMPPNTIAVSTAYGRISGIDLAAIIASVKE